MNTIKDLLDKHFKNIKVDKKLAKKINKFKGGWVASNSEFLGSGLIGSSNLYFKTSDVNTLLSDIFGIDVRSVRSDYKHIEAIIPSRKITSDVFNLAVMYMVHRFTVSNMTDKDKEKVTKDLVRLYNYRSIAALHSHRLPYLVRNEVAVTAYENLSNRYKLKQSGSWIKYVEYRTERVLDMKKSPHVKAITTFKDDKAVLNLLSDTQGRVRSFFNLYMGELMRVKETGEAMISSSSEVTIGEDRTTVDIKNNVSDSISKVLTNLETVDDFVDLKIVNIISDIIPGSSPDLLISTLSYMATKKSRKIKKFIEKSLLFDYKYLLENGYLVDHKDDLPYLVMKIRGAYTSSRTSNKDVLELREVGMKIAKNSSNKVNKQTLARIRTGVLMYVFVLSFIKG